MENLAKMADFLAQMLYKVFDLIWSLEVPGTKIQLIFPLFLMLAVEFLMAIILGFGSQQVNLERERRYAVKNSGRLSAWGKVKKHHQEISARINKQDKQVGNFHHKKAVKLPQLDKIKISNREIKRVNKYVQTNYYFYLNNCSWTFSW